MPSYTKYKISMYDKLDKLKLNGNRFLFWDLFHLSLAITLLFEIPVFSSYSVRALLKIALLGYLFFRISGLIKFYWAYLILATVYLFAGLELALYFRSSLMGDIKKHNQVYYSGEYSQSDDTLGFKFRNNTKGVFHTRIYHGDTSFHVQYCSDSQGFRIPCTACPEVPDSTKTKQAFFVGCSFTFGCGLEYPYSLPALFASKLADYSVINQGFNG